MESLKDEIFSLYEVCLQDAETVATALEAFSGSLLNSSNLFRPVVKVLEELDEASLRALLENTRNLKEIMEEAKRITGQFINLVHWELEP